MATDTLLVAVGEEDSGRIDEIAETVGKIAKPSDSDVVVAHVLSEDEFNETAETIGASHEGPKSFVATTVGEVISRKPLKESEKEPEGSRPEAAKEAVNRKQVVRDLGEALEDADVEYEVRGAVGDPAERIIGLADEVDADFVTVGGRNQSMARKALFGSVSGEIIRKVDRPVISVPEGEE